MKNLVSLPVAFEAFLKKKMYCYNNNINKKFKRLGEYRICLFFKGGWMKNKNYWKEAIEFPPSPLKNNNIT